MGRNNADFQNHILVHRGISGTSVRQLLSSPRNLGKHWSSDEFIAQQFAGNDSRTTKGAVITGLVHPDDVMTPEEIKAHNASMPRKMIYTQEAKDNEREVPIRPGATVHITGGKDMTFFDEPQVKKATFYKKPKKAKA